MVSSKLVPGTRTRHVVYTPLRYLDQESFVNAIAPKDDLTRINRAQFGILFKVADRLRRGQVLWDDFFIFETILKRPDAEYWIAFQYFDEYVSCFFLFGVTLVLMHALGMDLDTSPLMTSRRSSVQIWVRTVFHSVLIVIG